MRYNIKSTISKDMTPKFDVCTTDEFLDRWMKYGKISKEFFGEDIFTKSWLGIR